jgi:hypothetical protein
MKTLPEVVTDPTACFYCGANVAKTNNGYRWRGQGERDHFPIPKQCGGTMTVPICITCHDMKDRYPLETWPIDWVFAIYKDWWKLSRESRLFLGKAMRICAEAQQELKRAQRYRDATSRALSMLRRQKRINDVRRGRTKRRHKDRPTA